MPVIKSIRYSVLCNLGNYNNERIGLSAQLEPEETCEQAFEALKEKVQALGSKNIEELFKQHRKAENTLKLLERKIKEMTEKWNATAEFLRAQGIKPEAPDMPQFVNLLPEASNELVITNEVIEAETEFDFDEDSKDNDDEDDDEY